MPSLGLTQSGRGVGRNLEKGMEPLATAGEKLMVPKVSFQDEQVGTQARPNRPQEPNKEETWGLWGRI